MHSSPFQIHHISGSNFFDFVLDKKIQQVVDELTALPHDVLIRNLTYWADAIDNHRYPVESDLPYEEFTRYDKGLYTCSFTMILDAGVYYLVKRFCMKHDLSRWSKVIISLGSATFGMYLIEQPIREHIPAVCDRLVPYIGHFPACMVYVVVVFIIAYIITLLMKCIPGLRRLL